VQAINLTMDLNDWATLQKNYLLDTYYHATFTWNGISENIGVRSHGQGSRSPIKPNLDLNFAHYTKTQTFLGLPFVILKANNDDPSNLSEWISMKLFRKMGIPAPREAPAQVYINGQLLGFYYIVEHIDETFLQRDFGESGGYLYNWKSANDYDFGNLGTDPTLYAQFLDLKTSQAAPDLQTFDNLVQVINQPASATFTDDAFIAAVSQYVDPKQFLTYGATEQVLAGTDSLIGGQQGINNFYLYLFFSFPNRDGKGVSAPADPPLPRKPSVLPLCRERVRRTRFTDIWPLTDLAVPPGPLPRRRLSACRLPSRGRPASWS